MRNIKSMNIRSYVVTIYDVDIEIIILRMIEVSSKKRSRGEKHTS